ncbi:MAG: rhodanese-like domain-containing protein [Bacteroidales bacterium]|nr:rhodanese-like domain-containing protein [Bacteroidales bacterium]
MEDVVLFGIIVIVLVVIGLRVFYAVRTKAQINILKPYKTLPSRQAYKLIQLNSENPVFKIVDIRSAEEFKKGHLLHASHIDFKDKHFVENLKQLPKEDIYLLYCANGTLTHKKEGNAMEIMMAIGFKKVVAIHKGYTAWKRNRLPVVFGE